MSRLIDDATQLRLADAGVRDALSRLPALSTPGQPSLLAVTKVASSYPKSAQVFFACAPLSVLGTEVEGGPGVLVSGASTFFALNLGSAVPPSGTRIVTTFVENRWVFRYDG